MINLNNIQRVHFIGIAGAGMRAIANIFIEKGYTVSGSDLRTSPTTDRFEKMGARICIGQRPENLQEGTPRSACVWRCRTFSARRRVLPCTWLWTSQT